MKTACRKLWEIKKTELRGKNTQQRHIQGKHKSIRKGLGNENFGEARKVNRVLEKGLMERPHPWNQLQGLVWENDKNIIQQRRNVDIKHVHSDDHKWG